MTSASTLAAEALRPTKAAKQAEESGNSDQARALYLQAAGKFNESNVLTYDKIEKSGLTENFYGYVLLFVGKAGLVGRMYKVAVVPKDIRKELEEILK